MPIKLDADAQAAVAAVAEEERTCPVCLEEVECARQLLCQHTLCELCTLRHARSCLGAGRDLVGGRVFCPKCRSVTVVLLDNKNNNSSLRPTQRYVNLLSLCQQLVANDSELLLGGTEPESQQPQLQQLRQEFDECCQQLQQLAMEEADLRRSISAKADDVMQEMAEDGEGDQEAEDGEGRVRRAFASAVRNLLHRQHSAAQQHDALWCKLRLLEFAIDYHGVGLLGNFAVAWQRLVDANPSLQLEQQQQRSRPAAGEEEAAEQLKFQSFFFLRLADSVADNADGQLQLATMQQQQQLQQGPLVSGKLLWRLGKDGDEQLEFRWPVHATFARDSSHVIVSDKNNYRLQIISDDGNFVKFIAAGSVKPRRAMQASDGNYYICDETAACVKVYDSDGQFKGRLGEGIFQCPSGIAETKAGNLVFADLDHAFIITLNPRTGQLVKKFHTRSSADVYIPSPHFIALDDDDYIIVADSLNNCIKTFDPRGRLINKFGSSLRCPRGVVLDHHGNLLVVSSDTHSVQMYTQAGKRLPDLLTAADGLSYPMSAAYDHKLKRLLITQCSVYHSFEVLMFQLVYDDDVITIADKEVIA